MDTYSNSIFAFQKLNEIVVVFLFTFFFSLLSCSTQNVHQKRLSDKKDNTMNKNLDTTTLGAGCFWCVEAIFDNLKGVHNVESGYSGGHVENPSYEEICTGTTGHAEVTRITFDPGIISFEQLLDVFWHTHDPTTLNRQGADIGTQYRSVIFYHNESQMKIAELSKQKTEDSKLWDSHIVTEIIPLQEYYKAEDYHQDYYNLNTNKPYCSAIIAPKLQKFFGEFEHLLKDDFKTDY
jgi:peptide-methionine (S)-S-oxide reductase